MKLFTENRIGMFPAGEKIYSKLGPLQAESLPSERNFANKRNRSEKCQSGTRIVAGRQKTPLSSREKSIPSFSCSMFEHERDEISRDEDDITVLYSSVCFGELVLTLFRNENHCGQLALYGTCRRIGMRKV